MSQETNSADLQDEVTETSQTQAKTYTQKEFDDHMARMKSSITRKFEKQFEDLGDLDELRTLKQEAEKVKQEQALKRGEFEKILQENISKKDAEIAKRDSIIKEYKINTPLIQAASKYKAINAEQVQALLNNRIRLNVEGEVEVIDEKGAPMYSDKGTAVSVDDLVKDFLNKNSHFVSPTPSSTITKSNVYNEVKELDVTKLNMSDPKDREIYREYRAKNGIR